MIPTIERYAVRGVVGRGGTSVVREGWDRLASRPVALKRGPISRLAYEFSVLNTASAVNVYDFFQDGDDGVLVMELCIESLHDRVAKFGKPQGFEIEDIETQLFKSIDSFHRVKNHHGNISKENILVRSTGPLKVCLTDPFERTDPLPFLMAQDLRDGAEVVSWLRSLQ